ncbi:hypothetical protein [Aneurinibacillus tyrosinisolvens]|uniref:hypothetical protein n=1 Tax=Aneurinibacillus tyrosinisolvens TaxID=1443435 RepID=UPI00063F787F|nr:hypothetical protein [Aneurinibacillus tyrosinisolvens]
MDQYIEGVFFKALDGSPMLLHVDGVTTISLINREAVKIKHNGEWINGIHIGGDILYYGGKDKLRIGDKIRIKNKNEV